MIHLSCHQIELRCSDDDVTSFIYILYDMLMITYMKSNHFKSTSPKYVYVVEFS